MDYVDRVAARVAEAGGSRTQVAAAYLHAVAATTEWTDRDLAELGVSPKVRHIVSTVTWRSWEPVEETVRRLGGNHQAPLVLDASLRQLLIDEGPDIREYRRLRILEVLAAIEAPQLQAEEALRRLRAEPPGTDRWCVAAVACRRLGLADAVPVLLDSLGSLGSLGQGRYEICQLAKRAATSIINGKQERSPSASVEGSATEPLWVRQLVEWATSNDQERRYWSLILFGSLGDQQHEDLLIEVLAGTDDRLTLAAAHSLALIRGPKAPDALRSLLTDESRVPWVRAAAASGLGVLRDVSAVPALLGTISHPYGSLSTSSAEAIVRIGGESAVPRLVECVETGAGRETAAWALGELRAASAAGPLRRLIEESLAAGKVPSCAQVEALGKLADPASGAALVAVAGSDFTLTAQAAVRALRRVSSVAALDALARLSHDPRLPVRDDAIRALAAWDDPAVIPVLADHCGGPDARLVLARLAKGCDERALPAVSSVFQSTSDPDLRKLAGRALAHIGQPGPGIWAVLHATESPARRRAAIWVLGRTRDATVGPVLERALSDSDEAVRARAAEALGHIGNTDSDRAVAAALDDPMPCVRANAATALGKLGTATALAALRAHDDPNARVRQAVAAAIRRAAAPE